MGLLPSPEMSYYVFSLVPLAPLHQGRPAPRLPHRCPQPFAAINDDQHALRHLQAPITQALQKGREA